MTNTQEKELTAFLVLSRLRIEGRRRAVEFLMNGKSACETLAGLEGEGLTCCSVPEAALPEKELALCWEKGISLLTIFDPAYPGLLKEIPDPPLLLYMKGEIQENDSDAVAVVGTRHPSFYGRTQAKRFAGELAAKGLTIVSGLARGIDQTAHEAALEVSFGRTIAVLGCGLDVIYPKENEKLYHRIAERGAVLSEYALGTPPLAENFPKRNRIISGLSLGVFVVEAHSRSGSLITAHQALDQGREVFALPGPVDQLTSRGTHRLLKEGAALVEGPEDVFEALSQQLTGSRKTAALPALPRTVLSHSPGEKPDDPPVACMPAVSMETGGILPDLKNADEAIVSEILKEEGPLGADDILDFSGIDPRKLPALLLRLELAGRIKKTPEGKYSLK